MKSKNICIAGKNSIAVNGLRFICENFSNDFNIFGLINKNDSGLDTWQPSFKKILIELKIPIVSLDDLYEIENLIFISLEFDRIILPSKFKTKHLFNIHFSLLPSYKGMYTSALPILNNECFSGVTLHLIDSGIDTGKIIDQIKFTINDDDDSYLLYLNYNKFAYNLLIKNIFNLLNDNYVSTEQIPLNSSYYSRNSIDYNNLLVNYNQTAENIKNQIRAFAFKPYQLPKFKDFPIRFAKVTNQRSIEKPGRVIKEDTFTIQLSTIDYDVLLFKDLFNQTLLNIELNNNNLVKEFISLGYPLFDKNEKGWDLLIVATYFGNKEIFDLLIQNGADIHSINYNKTNLLMYSLTPFENSSNRYFFDKLISLGLDINKKDCFNLSTLDWIKKRNLSLIQ